MYTINPCEIDVRQLKGVERIYTFPLAGHATLKNALTYRGPIVVSSNDHGLELLRDQMHSKPLNRAVGKQLEVCQATIHLSMFVTGYTFNG